MITYPWQDLNQSMLMQVSPGVLAPNDASGGHLQKNSANGQVTLPCIHCSMDSQPEKHGLGEWVARISWPLTSDKAAWNPLDYKLSKVLDGAFKVGSAKCHGQSCLSVLEGVGWTTWVTRTWTKSLKEEKTSGGYQGCESWTSTADEGMGRDIRGEGP